VPTKWSSCTRFMMHKFKPAEFHAATCCGVKILSPKTRNLFIKSSQIRGLASASCPCFMTHKLKPAEFNATCCRDKFCPHNRFFNTTTQHNVCQEGWGLVFTSCPCFMTRKFKPVEISPNMLQGKNYKYVPATGFYVNPRQITGCVAALCPWFMSGLKHVLQR